MFRRDARVAGAARASRMRARANAREDDYAIERRDGRATDERFRAIVYHR
jgi:hypothetical protein